MATQQQPLKRYRVPLRITGTAFVMATSLRGAHTAVREALGGRFIAYDGERRHQGVEIGRALVIYGPEGVNEVDVIKESVS